MKSPQTKWGRGVYPAYLFHDHDPVLDVVDTVIKQSGDKLSLIAVRANVTYTTLTNWRDRKTKRPQWATVAAVVKAAGADIQIVYQGKVIPVRGGRTPAKPTARVSKGREVVSRAPVVPT